MADHLQRNKSVAFARVVVLVLDEDFNEFGCIGYQGFGMLKDGGYGEDGVLADVSMSVLETGSSGGEERFNEFGFAQFAEEAEGVAAYVFVWML